MRTFDGFQDGQSPLGARRHASEMRDAGLRLVRRANRWLIAGAVAGSGVLALVAKDSFHGRTVSAGAGASSASSAPATQSSPGQASSPSGDGTVAPQPPAQPPAPAARDSAGPSAVGSDSGASGPVVSGGS